MREIEFRGKDRYCNEWVYGSLVCIPFDDGSEYCCIMDNNCDDEDLPYTNNDYGTFDGSMTPVDKETIGEYTGRKDKNSTKIFEGDIVEFETNVNCITSELKPYWKDCYEKQYALGNGTWWVRKDQAIVQWNSKDGMWNLKVYNNGRYKRKSKLFTYRESDYVVIGNIHDNPELLGEKDE